jgi:predicted RNA-binding Zn-ribbon protein involved in translation (DUF1610 family)
MGYYKKLAQFCRTHGREPTKQNQDYFDAATKYGLSFRQVIAMIARDGHSSSPCPHCGKSMISRSGHCFYCGKSSKSGKNNRADANIDRLLEEARQARNKEHALKLWDETVSIIGTAGERYLAARKLELPPNADAVLRWHPSCKFGRDRMPCMVALFRDTVTDEPTAVHRTYIYSTSQAERMALGPIAGAAIKLWPLDGSETLAVGEGIETVLAAVKLGHASPPAWATSVANNLSKLPTIDGVRRLIILADNDASRTGEINARELRRKWKGKDVVIRMPVEIGSDFNDLLRRT